eukprot:5046359-Prymnesium_polylepis.1
MLVNQRETHIISCWLMKKPDSSAIGMIEPGAARKATSIEGVIAQMTSDQACAHMVTVQSKSHIMKKREPSSELTRLVIVPQVER